jgi:serine/threonine-protein kinase
VLGDYRLIAMRGRGGMGEVWEAEAPGGAHVAVKLMHEHLVDDPDLVQRFEREFQTGRMVQHPSLVQMFDSGQHKGVPFLVMELAEGKSLRALVDKGAPFFQDWEAAEVGRQMASALGVLHAANIVHRDLKSSNIMVDRELRAKLIDFGIVRMTGRTPLTPTDAIMGTAEFAAPETYFGRRHTGASDIYALGVVMYEMVCGRPPFRGDRYADVLKMHAELPPPRISHRVPEVSRQLDNLVHQMLQKQAGKRPSPAQVEAGCRSVVVASKQVAAAAQPSPAAAQAPRPAIPPRPQEPVVRRQPQPPVAPPLRRRPSPALFVLTAILGLAVVAAAIAASSMVGG